MADDFPQVFRVQQRLDATPPVAVAASVADGFAPIRGQLKPGLRVGVGGGSRGISNLAEAIAAVIGELKKAGTEPFIIPAMGSHGGATPEGQVAVLAGYGVTEASMGVPIRASMEVRPLGQTEEGQEVLWSCEAAAADGIRGASAAAQRPLSGGLAQVAHWLADSICGARSWLQ